MNLKLIFYELLKYKQKFFFHRFIFSPFGRSLGIKTSRVKKAAPNPILDKAYNGKKIKQKQVKSFNYFT